MGKCTHGNLTAHGNACPWCRNAELEAELSEAHVLLSQWYETWNDGMMPSGDLLADTDKAIAGEGGDG